MGCGLPNLSLVTRLLPLLLLAPLLRADDAPVVLREARAWRGVVEVRSASIEPAGGRGREEQTERVEFVVITRPPRRTIGPPRLAFEQAAPGTGRYEMRLDQREGGGGGVTVQGASEGRLHPHVSGFVLPRANTCKLVLRVTPDKLVAKTTLSGVDDGRFQTFRTVTTRAAFLDGFVAEGALEDGRVLAGERTFQDRNAKYRRDVRVTWRLERVDPVIRGRAVDHLGRPLAGLRVVATTTNAQRRANRLPPLRREGETDAAGRFALEAFHAAWGVQVYGAVREDVVVEGAVVADAQVKFDEAPDLEFELDLYRKAALPDARLLRTYFQGDVERYFAYVRERAPERRLRAALLAPPAER